MNNASNPVDLAPILLTILAVAAIPIGLYLAAILITYYRRQQQQRANPEIRFNTSLLAASFWTFSAIFIPLMIFYGLFIHYENGQFRFRLQFDIFEVFTNNPRGILIGILGLLVVGYLAILAYILLTVKPMLYRGQYERALKALRRWRWIPFSNLFIADFEGSVLLFAGRFAEAEQAIRKTVKRTEKSAREYRGITLGNLGWALLRQGRLEEAISCLEESVRKYPEGTDNFNALGEAFLLQGTNPAAALQYLERGILNKRYKMKTDRYVWGELLANRAWALAQAGSGEEAVQAFKKALAEADKECIPVLGGIHYRGAQIMRLCGTPEQVDAQLDQAIRLDPMGGYGQLAKAMKTAHARAPEQPGTAHVIIKASPAVVAQTIRKLAAASHEVRVIRENLVLLVTASPFAYLYLVRPQPDGMTLLRLIVHKTPLVEAAVSAPDLKTGLANLLASPELKTAAPTAATEHLQAIAQAASPATDATTARPVIAPLPAKASSSDPFEVLARKPLPTVTAATPQHIQPGTLNPTWYAIMGTFFGGILMTPFMAYKWRSLGKPSWMWWTLAAAILTVVVTIGVIIALWRVMPPGPGQYILGALGLGVNYGFIFALASLQEGAFQRVRQEGPDALTGYSYNFARAGLIGGGFIAGSILLGLVVYATRPAPVKFDHKLLALTYPADWKTADVTESGQCDTAECFLFLYEGRFGYTALVIGRFWLDSAMTASEVERFTWADVTRLTPGSKLDSRDTLKVGGVSAARRFFSYPSSSTEDMS